MALCDEVHREYDALANGSVQIGELPPWTHVHGRMAFYVYQGPYGGLADGWREFHHKRAALDLEVHGPPGDVYACDPDDHKGSEARIITLLWVPLK